MVFWSVFILLLFVIVVYLILRKVYNEYKIRKGRQALAGKVVVITGASSGIGEALALEFYAAGCKVVLASRRVGELERVRRNLLSLQLTDGIQAIRPEIVPLDLADLDQLPEKANQILTSCSHVDVLINNGGVSLRSDVMTVKKEVDIQLMYVNYLGANTFTKAFLPSMVERRQGQIIFISSVVGRLPIPYRSAYTASKHALQAFADCLRSEMAAHNIKVMVASPGYVATDVSRNALTGYGTLHGVMDPETAAGERPQHCAQGIMKAMLRGDYELTPFCFLPVIWLRVTWPWIYFRAMELRAQKLAARHRTEQTV